MNQQIYIMSAILLIVVGTTIYYGFKKLPRGKDVDTGSSVTINYDKPVDSLSKIHSDGKRVYQIQCASCHSILRDMVGPAMGRIPENSYWSDKKKLYKYIRQPELFNKDNYIDSLRRVFGGRHRAFPNLSDEEISAILNYITLTQQAF